MRRRRRIRSRIKGTAQRPRLSIFRSNRHLRIQLIDDTAGRTIAAASDRDIKEKKGTRSAAGEILGGRIARKAKDAGVIRAVFDRGGYRYHGIVQAVAEGARKAGLKI